MFLRLSDNFIPRHLEKLYLLDKQTDELYELNEEAFYFVVSLKDGIPYQDVKAKKSFVNRLLKLGILTLTERKKKRQLIIKKSPIPSLRYLEIQLTSACNLKCKHCYQSEKKNYELPFEPLKKVLKEFTDAQGLRILLSGGEPLLYSRFGELSRYLKNYPAYVVLLTNGTLITEKHIKLLKNIDEIQFSIDGLEESHDYLRGKGSFKRLMKAIYLIKEKTDKSISFATMVHKKNLKDFPKLSRLVKSLGAKEWGIDYPILTGFFSLNKELYPAPEEALKVMKYRFGASYHLTETDSDFACGTHLMTLLPDGSFVPCGFYPDRAWGNINSGLTEAIQKRSFYKLSDILDCKGCEYLYNCRGGCRFRAGGVEKKDSFMCKLYGVNTEK